jgi:bacteriocin biosynthesis cyclodehydratase domain-containing protein
MVFALDPRIQRVWRTPDSIQFGVDEPVLVLDGVTAAEERMLAALAAGVTAEGMALVARKAGASEAETGALLHRVAPVLLRPQEADGADRARRPLTVAFDGGGRTAAVLEGMLREAGAVTGMTGAAQDPAEADAAVLIGAYAIQPQRHARWLRRDVPHLPIVFGDSGVTVGPLVRPGLGPCLRCVDLHRTDADPAWPAMATQLHTREAPAETAVLAAAAAARAAAVLSAWWRDGTGSGDRAPGVSARLAMDATDWVSRTWDPHPECGCLALPP